MAKQNLTVSSVCDESILLPRKILDVIKGLGEDELKLFIYACGVKRFYLGDAATELGITVESAEKALSALQENGLISLSNEKEKPVKTSSVTQYNGEELAEAMKQIDEFKSLTVFASERIGKVLNRNDINTLYNLYDYHAISADFICGVIGHCVSKGKTGMAYIHSVSLSLVAEGIDSYEKLEAHFKHKSAAESKIGKFRKMFGFGNRELSTKEKQFFQRWFDDMDLSFDLVKFAYERMVDRIGEVKLPYMAKILEQWYAKGWTSVDKVKSGESNETKIAVNEGKSYDTDDFFEAAARKGYLKVSGNSGDNGSKKSGE